MIKAGITPITDDKQYQNLNQPLASISREISQNAARINEIEVEFLRKAQDEPASAFENYLIGTNGQASHKAELRQELQQRRERQAFLEAALQEGRDKVDLVRNRLSRKPCEQGRKLSLDPIMRIIRAQDEIATANRELITIRQRIEDAGYRAGALPPAEFNLQVEGWRKYIRENYSEITHD